MDEPIRILQVLGIMNRGGAENMVMNLYRSIDREKIQFDFIVHTDQAGAFDEEIKILGGKIFHAPKYSGINHFQYVKWWKTFFKNHSEYKVIHSHIRSTASLILSIAKKNGLKTIAHSHSTSNGSGMGSFVKRVFQKNIVNHADFCFACSKESGEWLFPNKNFFVLNNAIDTAKFTFSPDARAKIRQELGLSEDCLVIGTVGRLTTPKNPHGIIDIWKEIVAKAPNAKFLWVGDGEMRAEIEARIQKETLSDSIIMTGVQPRVEWYYSAMDAFIMPSLWEGLPVSLIEAQSTGMPCFCSETISHESAVTEACVFLPISQPELWAEKILGADMERKNVSAQICKAGFDIQTTSKWLANFYLSL